MKASELRIGNYAKQFLGVSDNGAEYKEIEIDGNDINRISELKHHDIEPIELTEEWLIKLGFQSNQVSYKIDNERFIFELYFYDAWNLNYVEKHKFGNGSVELSGYWKIHDIQNLYFVLTGEELQLK